MDQKEIARSYFQRVASGDLDAVNELVTAEFVDHDSPPGTRRPGGREGVRRRAMISHRRSEDRDRGRLRRGRPRCAPALERAGSRATRSTASSCSASRAMPSTVVGVRVGCMRRLETFADGVFAIAATLLIIDVARRTGEPRRHSAPGCVAAVRGLCRLVRDDRDHVGEPPPSFRQIARRSHVPPLNLRCLLCIAFVRPDPDRGRAPPGRRRPGAGRPSSTASRSPTTTAVCLRG